MKKIIFIGLSIISFLNSNAQFGEQQVIDDSEIPSPWSIYVVDLDGDGYLDLLATEELYSQIVWYKNVDGLGNFGEQQIITNTLEYTRYVAAADIDGDGDMDVIATSASNDLVVWYENEDGLGDFGLQQVITSEVDLPLMTYVADLDNDNDLDVLTASQYDGKLAWYENTDGLGTFGNQQIIGITQSASSIFVTDIDGDGDGDVISDRSSNGYPCWYENLDGLGNFGSQQEIGSDTIGSYNVIADDVDGDGDMDVLNIEFGGETIAWYENTDGLGAFGPKQIIMDEVRAPRQIFMADFDNDGDKDVLYNSSELVDPDYLAWQENDGHGNFGEEQVISTNIDAPRGLFSADIDNDGDMDVFSSSIGDHKLAWYENLTILGIEETLALKIKIHPNPANTRIHITNTSAYAISAIQIRDIQGKFVKHVELDKNQLDISNLQSGVYLVSLTTDQGRIIKKIIKE